MFILWDKLIDKTHPKLKLSNLRFTWERSFLSWAEPNFSVVLNRLLFPVKHSGSQFWNFSSNYDTISISFLPANSVKFKLDPYKKTLAYILVLNNSKCNSKSRFRFKTLTKFKCCALALSQSNASMRVNLVPRARAHLRWPKGMKPLGTRLRKTR